MSRDMTCKLLEMIEQGILDRDTVIMACVKYMSEADVEGMMQCNEFICEDDEPEDEPEDEDAETEEEVRG